MSGLTIIAVVASLVLLLAAVAFVRLAWRLLHDNEEIGPAGSYGSMLRRDPKD